MPAGRVIAGDVAHDSPPGSPSSPLLPLSPEDEAEPVSQKSITRCISDDVHCVPLHVNFRPSAKMKHEVEVQHASTEEHFPGAGAELHEALPLVPLDPLEPEPPELGAPEPKPPPDELLDPKFVPQAPFRHLVVPLGQHLAVGTLLPCWSLMFPPHVLTGRERGHGSLPVTCVGVPMATHCTIPLRSEHRAFDGQQVVDIAPQSTGYPAGQVCA